MVWKVWRSRKRGGENSLLHQRYMDDTGISLILDESFFHKMQHVIQEFEAASDAKLNVSKSRIMPMTTGPLPGWVYETGCEVIEEGKSFIYLGVSTSCPVDGKEIARSIIRKKEKNLAQCCLSDEGIKALEKLCREFLWGWNMDGNPKTSLIAWDGIAPHKDDDCRRWVVFSDSMLA
ncbi:hypothetical protein R1sor_014773 [Riccia sorocarpa]|uniref:Reverse transcriptase domain-containing protein n=1 Tax=Riccia sorocarpa TaxID=122646 RepID=A0ABD3HE76_9MARC